MIKIKIKKNKNKKGGIQNSVCCNFISSPSKYVTLIAQ